MSDEAPMTLDDFRVMAGIGRVVLAVAADRDERRFGFLQVAMTTREARDLAADLIARAERVEGERR
jgi:hypothetical protein